jgi:hypothetical protein
MPKPQQPDTPAKKKKSGIPTGNAGEYFVMGELLKRGFDAQLADRNTKGYDLLVGMPKDKELRKVQVKTVRRQPWYVRVADFAAPRHDQVTVYVLLGKEDGDVAVRYFIARNSKLREHVSKPDTWKDTAFMLLRSVTQYENQWNTLRTRLGRANA